MHTPQYVRRAISGVQSILLGENPSVETPAVEPFPLPVAVAFQPIFQTSRRSIYAYEALARTVEGQGFPALLRHVTEQNRFCFDQKCRAAAMSSAERLGLATTGASLCLNINPNSAMNPEACIDKTLQLAHKLHFPINRIILEVTEDERAKDPERLNEVVQAYRRLGMRVAIDDFGAGYAGLSMLAQFSVDIVKVDIQLVRNINRKDKHRAIVEMILAIASRLGVEVIAEGVETEAEYRTLRSLGVDLMQGYLLARPGFQFLPVSYGWAAYEALPAAA